MLKFCIGCLAIICIVSASYASPNRAPSFIAHSVPQAQSVGQGQLTYMTRPIYNATLYAPNGELNSEQPLALKITYLRSLSGRRIADRTAEEMRYQGFKDEVILAGWHDKMLDIFPDVKYGTELTGVLTAQGTTIFYSNGKEIGRISDSDFSRHFFSIWLSPKTSEPEMRKKLLNLGG